MPLSESVVTLKRTYASSDAKPLSGHTSSLSHQTTLYPCAGTTHEPWIVVHLLVFAVGSL